MLSLNVTEICKIRQIERPYTFLVKAGISPHTANDIVNGYSRAIRLDHIEKLCEILHCEPNDLLAFKPSANVKITDNHPLNKLIPKQSEFDWQQTLKTLPLEQLKEVADFINKPKENKED
ncbi:helix-turn-helix domain-containing protein [Flavobacterium sp. XGLA_31]|uniref:helix-turn-helix domain-containing protein n=1 Tax=Flavobacterium sp. XGLA_31 TaxID=3447666 RepID=UPI003F354B53